MAERTGRNEPCPCGSGLKYKRCCLAKEEALDLPWQRLRRIDEAMTGELARFAQQRLGDEYVEKAFEEFHLWDEPPTDARGEPIDLGAAFIPWLLYCFEPDRGDDETPIEWPSQPVALTYLEEKGARLSELERSFLRAACEPAFSFFAVEAVDPGKGMELHDLLTGETHCVREKLGSEGISRGCVVFARVVSVEGVSILLGCGPVAIPADHQIELIDLREELAGEGGRLRPEQLADFDFEVREWYLETLGYLYHPEPPQLQNTDGEPLAPRKLFFELACPPADAFAALRDLALDGTQAASDEDLLDDVRRDAAGELRSLSFAWLRQGNTMHSAWENTVLGKLAIDGSRLTAEVNSEVRAEGIRAEIEARLGSRVHYRRTRAQSLEKMLAAAGDRPPSAADRRRDEESRALSALPEVKRLLERHWEAWLDAPIPALRDETPRQAATSERGRERLEALLAGYEDHGEGGSDAIVTPDVGFLREKLGLPPRPAVRP